MCSNFVHESLICCISISSAQKMINAVHILTALTSARNLPQQGSALLSNRQFEEIGTGHRADGLDLQSALPSSVRLESVQCSIILSGFDFA